MDRIALAKQGDNEIGSIRPSVCLSVSVRSHNQSKVFVCVWNNCTDAVDRFLIYKSRHGFMGIY